MEICFQIWFAKKNKTRAFLTFRRLFFLLNFTFSIVWSLIETDKGSSCIFQSARELSNTKKQIAVSNFVVEAKWRICRIVYTTKGASLIAELWQHYWSYSSSITCMFTATFLSNLPACTGQVHGLWFDWVPHEHQSPWPKQHLDRLDSKIGAVIPEGSKFWETPFL